MRGNSVPPSNINRLLFYISILYLVYKLVSTLSPCCLFYHFGIPPTLFVLTDPSPVIESHLWKTKLLILIVPPYSVFEDTEPSAVAKSSLTEKQAVATMESGLSRIKNLSNIIS